MPRKFGTVSRNSLLCSVLHSCHRKSKHTATLDAHLFLHMPAQASLYLVTGKSSTQEIIDRTRQEILPSTTTGGRYLWNLKKPSFLQCCWYAHTGPTPLSKPTNTRTDCLPGNNSRIGQTTHQNMDKFPHIHLPRTHRTYFNFPNRSATDRWPGVASRILTETCFVFDFCKHLRHSKCELPERTKSDVPHLQSH